MAKKTLILAIERDSDQARLLSEVIHQRLRADLVLAETVEHAMTSLRKRVPDLVLIPALLSPREESALRDGLRANGGNAHVQLLTIPMLAPTVEAPKPRGMLSRFRRDKSQDVTEAGFSPAAFAEQIAEYLEKSGGAGRDAGRQHEEEGVGTAPAAAAAKPNTAREIDPVKPAETGEPFDHAMRLRDEPADPPIDVEASAAIDATSASADSPDLTDAMPFQVGREAQPASPTVASTQPEPPAAAATQEAARSAMPDASDAFGPIELALSDDNADWTAVMESFRGDLGGLTESPIATDLAPAPKDQTSRTEWAGINPLDSGFPTLLGRLHQLMEDADRTVA